MGSTSDNRRAVWLLFASIGSVTIIADQVTKVWARNSLPANGAPISVIENFWDWSLHYNTGSAFSLFQNASWGRAFLTIVGVVAIGAIFWMVTQAKLHQKRQLWALGLIAGGAIGNLFDRIAFGKVTDFVVWKYYAHTWPVFNIADFALCIGVGFLVLDMLRTQKSEPELNTDSDGTTAT